MSKLHPAIPLLGSMLEEFFADIDMSHVVQLLESIYLLSTRLLFLLLCLYHCVELSELIFKVKNTAILAGRPTPHPTDIYTHMRDRNLKSRTIIKFLNRCARVAPLFQQQEHDEPIDQIGAISSLSSSLLRINANEDVSNCASKLFGEGYPPFPSAHTYRSTNVIYISALMVEAFFTLDGDFQEPYSIKNYYPNKRGASETGKKPAAVAANIKGQSSHLCFI